MSNKLVKRVDILIASPGDTSLHRAIVRDVIQQWSAMHGHASGMILNPIGWEHDAGYNDSAPIQDLINGQLLERADHAIVVFHTRIGSETANFISGTVEELMTFRNAGKTSSIYFSEEPMSRPDSAQRAQLDLLEKFRASLLASRIAVQAFKNETEFRTMLARDLNYSLRNVPHLYSGTRLDPKFDPNVGTPSMQSLPPRHTPVVQDHMLTEEARKILMRWRQNDDMYLLAGESGNGYFAELGETCFTKTGRDGDSSGASWERATSQLIKLGYVLRKTGRPGVQPHTLTADGLQAAKRIV